MLYTGKGDNGTTKLFGCTERIAKDDARIDALGNLDELNSWIGLCAAQAADTSLQSDLHELQETLFIIQAQVAGADKQLQESAIRDLEATIASIETEIPPITSFTIAGATLLSASLDVARTISRRTERSIVSLHDSSLASRVIPYCNRLSSVLFAYARLSAHRVHVSEKAPHY